MGAPDNAYLLRAQGLEALREHQDATAADLLSRYLDTNPNDREAEIALAVARTGQGRFGAALAIFDRHLEREPASPLLHYNRAMTLDRMGKKGEAAKTYEQVLRLKPDHANARERLSALNGAAAKQQLVAAVVPSAPPPPAKPPDPPPAKPANRPAPPLPAKEEEIPVVIAVEDEEAVEVVAVAGESRRKKERWIHPAWLVGLVLYLIAVIVCAFVATSAYPAGVRSGAAVLSALMFLAGLQAAHRARHGLSRLPEAVGYVLLIIGALGLLYDGAMNVYDMVNGPATGRNPVAGRQAAAANAQPAQDQALRRPGPTITLDDVTARENASRNPGLIDTAIQAIRGGDDTKIGAACLALADNYRDARKSEVIPLLEGLLTHPRIPIRRDAAKALGTWGTQQSIPRLEALAGDRSGLVRSAAAKAIEKIKQRKS